MLEAFAYTKQQIIHAINERIANYEDMIKSNHVEEETAKLRINELELLKIDLFG